MNIYFLVEGKRCEAKVYPAWLSYLVPELRRVESPGEVHEKNYYFISAEGYPSIIYKHIPNSVEDIKLSGKYNYFVVCLDAEEQAVSEVRAEIDEFLTTEKIELVHTQLYLIIQNRCIETWFLGNRRIYSRNPQAPPILAEYTRYYNVSTQDPEIMGKYQFNTHAQFHAAYLRALFEAKKIRYSKRNPGDVLKESYLKQLLNRVADNPQHLPTFQHFINFCEMLKPKLKY